MDAELNVPLGFEDAIDTPSKNYQVSSLFLLRMLAVVLVVVEDVVVEDVGCCCCCCC